MDDSAIITNLITLLAGLGGAILGSWVSGRIAGSHADAEKVSKQKTEFFKVMIKSSLIQSDFTNLKRTLDDAVVEANKIGMTNQPKWTKVQSNPDEFEKIEITPDDLVCLFEAREFDLLSDLVAVGMKHSKMIGAFNTYSRLRLELKDHMPKSDMNGPVVGSLLNQDDLLRLQPRFLELSSLLESIDQLLPMYVQESSALSEKLGPAARKYFKDSKFPILKAI
jgi:hypothetical protein